LVGSKDDKKDKHVVDQADVKRFAKRVDAPAFFVSAVANTGVHGSFRAIVDALIEKWPDGPRKAHRDAVKIGAPYDKPASRCCGL